MKRFVFLAVVALLAAMPVCALAAPYTDTQNLINVELPDEENSYYYTPESSTLFADLQEKLDSTGSDVRLFIASYAPDNNLSYSVTTVAQPLDAAADQAGSGVTLLDVTALDENHRQSLLDDTVLSYDGAYVFEQPVNAQLGGQPAILLRGVSADDPALGCDVYLTANSSNVLRTSVAYTSEEAQQAAQARLETLSFGEPQPTVTPAPAPVELTPAPTAVVLEATPAPTATAPPTPAPPPEPTQNVPAFFQNISDGLAAQYYTNPYFFWYVIGAFALLALVIFLLLLAASAYRKRKAAKLADGGSLPREEAVELVFKNANMRQPVSNPSQESDNAADAGQPSILETQQAPESMRPGPAAAAPIAAAPVFAPADTPAPDDYDAQVARFSQEPESDVNDIQKHIADSRDEETPDWSSGIQWRQPEEPPVSRDEETPDWAAGMHWRQPEEPPRAEPSVLREQPEESAAAYEGPLFGQPRPRETPAVEEPAPFTAAQEDLSHHRQPEPEQAQPEADLHTETPEQPFYGWPQAAPHETEHMETPEDPAYSWPQINGESAGQPSSGPQGDQPEPEKQFPVWNPDEPLSPPQQWDEETPDLPFSLGIDRGEDPAEPPDEEEAAPYSFWSADTLPEAVARGDRPLGFRKQKKTVGSRVTRLHRGDDKHKK